MSLVDQALWYLESHYREPLLLSSVADALGVSRFHLSRAFRYATGLSPAAYLRRRRLTEGARALVDGHEDILELALSLGYGSHEAFGRAFKDAFALTPEQVRQRSSLEGLATLEPIFNRSQAMTISLDAQIREQASWYVAGLLREHAQMPSPEIPSQWQDFASFIGSVPGQVGERTYGIVPHDGDEDADNQVHSYLCAVEVADVSLVSEPLSTLKLSPQTYAVFQHSQHVSQISQTFSAAYNHWLPDSDFVAVPGPCIEAYGDAFDPQTGHGGFEIWVPVARP